MRVLKYYVESKAHLRHENKVNENKVLSYCEALRCETMKKLISFMSELQAYYQFKLDFQKKWTNIQEASGWYTAPNAARTISCKAWNSLVEYPSRDGRHDIEESEGNKFNPIFKDDVQGQKHPGSCALAEPEVLIYRKAKHVVQKVYNGHKNPNNSHNYHAENHDEMIIPPRK